jgi:hypothetical protein
VAISAKFAWSGALFAPSDPLPVSRHSDRLFARVRGIIKDGFADPDFGPREVAVEAGISVHATSSSSSRRAARPAANSYYLVKRDIHVMDHVPRNAVSLAESLECVDNPRDLLWTVYELKL